MNNLIKNTGDFKLKDLTFEESNQLKKMGYLWEFYPDAPEFHQDIIEHHAEFGDN